MKLLPSSDIYRNPKQFIKLATVGHVVIFQWQRIETKGFAYAGCIRAIVELQTQWEFVEGLGNGLEKWAERTV